MRRCRFKLVIARKTACRYFLIMNLTPSHRPKSCSKIRFVISTLSDKLTDMLIARELDTATFEFAPIGLMRFRKAVVLWQKGQEDFSVHPSKHSDGIKDRQSGEVGFGLPSLIRNVVTSNCAVTELLTTLISDGTGRGQLGFHGSGSILQIGNAFRSIALPFGVVFVLSR